MQGAAHVIVALMHLVLNFTKFVGSHCAEYTLLSHIWLHLHALMHAGKVKRIVCMCGAGLSVSAGIPDFRTPGTGLYSNLQKYDLPFPEAVFEINYFKRNPAPFFMLAKVSPSLSCKFFFT